MAESQPMAEHIFAVVFIAIWVLAMGGYGLFVYKRPEVVDTPMLGWWGRVTGKDRVDPAERYRQYRKYARRTLLVAAIGLILLLIETYSLLQIIVCGRWAVSLLCA